MNDLNKELGLASPYNQTISLNDSLVRTLLGKVTAATTISLSGAYGLSSTSKFTAANTQNLNIWNVAVAGGWNKSSAVEYTIPAGVYIWSDSTSLPALETGGTFPGGLTIINNGYIMGKGGQGGDCLGTNGVRNTEAGGTAIHITTNVTIDNSAGYIGGGGGGGGQGYGIGGGGGGGAGGGRGGRTQDGIGSYYPPGGVGGAIGQTGGSGPGQYEAGTGKTTNDGGGAGGAGGGIWQYGVQKVLTYDNYSGGGGGRIMPGAGGVHRTINTSGLSGVLVAWGGDGGAGGAAGSNGNVNGGKGAGGGGGGWGASGGTGYYLSGNGGTTASPGAAGGKAINVVNNGVTYTVTWTGGFPSARVFGAIS
jgi:hypothetical protein